MLFSTREKVLKSFKSRIFPRKNFDKIPTPEPAAEPTPEVATEPTEATPTKHMKSRLKFHQEFMNEIIADQKDEKNEIFLDYFMYQNPLLLVKDLIGAKQNKNEKLVNNIKSRLTDLRSYINRKEILENRNPKKVVDIVEEILDFDKQKEGNGFPSNLATRTKQMNQRLQTAFAQVKALNTSEDLLNEIRKIIYSLYRG